MLGKKQDSVSFYRFSVCFLFSMVIVFGIIIYQITAREMKRQLGNRALGIASTVAAMLEEKPAEYREFIKTLDTSSDYYIKTKRLLEKIRFDNPDNIAFLTMEVKVSENEVMYPLIGEREGSPTYSPPGTVEPFTPTRQRAYDTQSAVIGDFVTTKWGTLLSAYVPVFDNRNGEFIGLAGTDISKYQYDTIMRKFLAIIVVSIAIIIIMGLVIIRLSTARIRADRENIVKSKFLSAMSHEIRTPLNAILGLAEVELQLPMPEKTRVNLEKIYSSGVLLLEIVNDILDISKIESDNFEIFPAKYDFPVMINDTVQLNIVRIGSKPIEFKLNIDETIPSKLYGDEVRVKQILNNLLSNAFKYTEKGETCFSAGWKQEGNDAWLEFTVKDTGRGIKEQDLEKLFLEYTQLELAVNRKIEGTGLGLFITKKLVERMGGSIAAESEYGKGSIFRVKLPQGIVDQTPIGADMAEKLRNFHFIEARSRGRGNTIIRSWMPYGEVLVVDDLQTNLDVMSGLLMPYGLKVDMVLSGREAVERIRARERRYNLVFMDHMMPEMDGIEAARIIRNEIGTEYAQTVPIIVLTANAIVGNRELFLKSGFNDYISKPIDIKLLDAVLNRWIRDRQSGETLKDAEDQARKRTENPGQESGAGNLDTEGRWLLEHPVEGVDFAAALLLYGNRGAAFFPILASFVTHTPVLLEKMTIHLESSAPDYTTEVHGFKGSCNAICAGGIAALAQELEFAAKEGDFDLVRSRHGELIQQARRFSERLKALLEEWEAKRPAWEKERRTEPDRKLLERLRHAAGEFNTNQIEDILKELEQYEYERGGELVKGLREQAGNFDYDELLRLLEK